MIYNIFIADYNKTTVLQFPVIPSDLPSLSRSLKNEEFETYWDGSYNFIEKAGLLSLALDSWLPVDASKYSFCKSKVNAIEIINLINAAIDKVEPLRIVISGGSGYVSDTFSVESFAYNVMARGDYKYNLGLKQWKNYNATVSSNTTTHTIGWAQDSTGWYYYTDTAGSYYKDSWQLVDNEWYSFDSQGYARQAVWLQDGGVWYWLKDSCKMARNETLHISGVEYTFDSTGAWV